MCLAVPGYIEEVSGVDPLARVGRVRFGAVVKEVSLACVPEAKAGDFVLVHVGIAIARIDEIEAQSRLQVLRALGEEVREEDG